MARRPKVSAELFSATHTKITYHPFGAIADLFKDHSDELLLAGPAGTGKSLGALQKLNLVLSKYPKAKAFMARKTRTSMTNSCIQTFDRHVLTPPDKVHFHKQDQQYNYPNGSMCAVIGLDDPERIKSTDWDLGFIQEATECSENDIEIATTRLRNWIVPYQQLIMDCNPDRPNHWLKKRCDRGQTKMLLTTHKDNPRLWDYKRQQWTLEGNKYLSKLDKLSGARRSRLFLGQWVSAEGMVYHEWDPQIHMISRNDLPAGWETWARYWAHDWGHIHPQVWQEWIENPRTGQLYRLREIYKTKLLVEDLGRWLKDLTYPHYIPRAIICDHDAEDRAVLERHTGYLTLPAYKSIAVGIQAVKRRLRKDWCPEGPGILFVRDALIHKPDEELDETGKPTKTEDEFDGYVWDKNPKEEGSDRKKDELPIDKDNHGLDPTRYMVAFADSLADDPEEFEGVLFNDDQVIISPF